MTIRDTELPNRILFIEVGTADRESTATLPDLIPGRNSKPRNTSKPCRVLLLI